MLAFWSPYGRAEGSTLHTQTDVDWFYTGIPFPLFNGVLRINTDLTGVQRTIDELQTRIDAQGAPALWWTWQQSQPAELDVLLQQAGLEEAGEVPAMAMELAQLTNQPEVPAHFSIEKVSGIGMQSKWARVAASGTGFSEVAIEELVRIESSLADPQYTQQDRYLGFLNGEPVASSALVLKAGVAGIYAVATLPEARCRGIGNLMAMLPLLEARERGYRVAILQASSAGYSIYKKMGFRDVANYVLYLQS